MELRQLSFFLGVADELNFCRAAEHMYIAQPALSQHIRRLERELGVALFVRHARGVRLTPAGQAFYDAARSTVERAEQAAWIARRAAVGEMGCLSIGAVPGLCARLLPELVASFRARHPEVTLEVRSLDPAEIDRQLRDGDLAVGMRAAPVEEQDLDSVTVGSEPLVALVPSDHRLATHPSISLRELAADPFVLPRRSAAPRLHDKIIGLCQEAGFSPRVAHEVDGGTALGLGVACHLGVSVAARVQAPSFSDRVVALALEEPAELTIVSLWAAGTSTPQVQAWRALLTGIDATNVSTKPGLKVVA